MNKTKRIIRSGSMINLPHSIVLPDGTSLPRKTQYFVHHVDPDGTVVILYQDPKDRYPRLIELDWRDVEVW